MVFYLKYRPQTLAEIIGQESLKKVLTNAIQSGNLAHAYLFCGPKGTGKTSTARILAKIVNCEKGSSTSHAPKPNSLPCNSCPSCLSITDGSNLDLIEIDAASNRGIDDIRALREKIKLSPSSAKKKVYIIDEVHMLTTEAFNALLKTLEEPPDHALFILATTEVNKIPATILSRVERLDFQLASEEQIKEAIKRVINQEKLKVDEEALQLLAKKADGSFRDGLKLLNQFSQMDKNLTVASLEEFFQSGSFKAHLELLEYVAQKDASQALNLLTKLTQEGVNSKELVLSLLSILRKVLFIQHGLKNQLEKDNNIESLTKLSEIFTSTLLLNLIQSLQECLQTIKQTGFPELALEIAILENCLDQKEVIVEIAKELPNIPQAPSANVTLETSSPTISSTSSDLQKLLDKWQFILETIKPYNYSLEALLRQVKVISCDDGVVLLEVPYSFHQRIIEAPKSRDLLESVVSDVLGKEAKMRTVLGSRPVRVEEIANVELAQDDDVIKIAAEIFNS